MWSFKRLLVCGGREYADRDKVYNVLDEFSIRYSSNWVPNDNWLPSDITTISGAAKGADRIAIDWATVNYARLEEYPANWADHGKSAGYIRNRQMLEEGKPDVVIAFPGGRGTAMMVKLAKDAGVPVYEITS